MARAVPDEARRAFRNPGDAAIFAALHQVQNQRPWWQWPSELRDRDPKALGAVRDELRREIYEWEFFSTEPFDLSSPGDGNPLDLFDWKNESR